jgi:hypothetical protein
MWLTDTGGDGVRFPTPVEQRRSGVPAGVLATLAHDRDIEVLTHVARSPRLTARVASALAEHPHVAVRHALATNETTPPSLLAAMAGNSGRPAE